VIASAEVKRPAPRRGQGVDGDHAGAGCRESRQVWTHKCRRRSALHAAAWARNTAIIRCSYFSYTGVFTAWPPGSDEDSEGHRTASETNPKEVHLTTKSIDKQRLRRPVLSALPDGQEFVTAREFAGILKLSRRTLARLRARGDLPAPVQVTTNNLRWRAGDVRDFLNNLKTRKQPRRRA
jgi:predicted DNA-binding transcriptional regulator AlpA